MSDKDNMNPSSDSNRFSISCIECNRHHSLGSWSCCKGHMQKKKFRNKRRSFSSFVHCSGILCSVSFDKRHKGYWRTCSLIGILDTGKKCCKICIQLECIWHIRNLQVYSTCQDLRNNILSIDLLYWAFFYMILYSQHIGLELNDNDLPIQERNHSCIVLDLMMCNIMS